MLLAELGNWIEKGLSAILLFGSAGSKMKVNWGLF